MFDKGMYRFVFLSLMILLAALSSCVSGGTVPTETVPPEISTAPPEQPPALTEPASWPVLNRMAEFLSRGDFDGALALFDQIAPDEAESSGIRLLKASVLGSAGRYAEGRVITEGVMAEEPDNLDALYVLATLEGAAGKEREQRTILERIIKNDPVNTQALIDLGNIALRARSYRTAGSYFDRALAAEPQNLQALLGRAGVYRYNRDPKKAEELLNRAISLYPAESGPRAERGRLYRNEGYLHLALEDLDRAKQLDGGSYWITVDRGNVLLDLNRKQEALEEFTRAIALAPDNFLAYVYSAGIKDEAGDYEGAEHDYTILARLKPDYYFAHEGIGMHKMRKKLWAEARDAFLEAYRYAPNESNYALLAAMNWMRAGKIADPRQFLEQAIRTVQRDTLEWYMLRLYHDLSGDNDLAIRIDREKNLANKARMLYYLANYYDIRGNKVLADRYFLEAKNLNQGAFPEWRLNEWAVAERGLASF
jgi:tetratricopeptide (TPR) repeat protein